MVYCVLGAFNLVCDVYDVCSLIVKLLYYVKVFLVLYDSIPVRFGYF